jgi:hypothetical protein
MLTVWNPSELSANKTASAHLPPIKADVSQPTPSVASPLSKADKSERTIPPSPPANSDKSERTAIANICANCNAPSKFSCSRCLAIRYCNAECQKTHWKVHKSACDGGKK